MDILTTIIKYNLLIIPTLCAAYYLAPRRIFVWIFRSIGYILSINISLLIYDGEFSPNADFLSNMGPVLNFGSRLITLFWIFMQLELIVKHWLFDKPEDKDKENKD